jgi:hypothetical protein
MRADNGEAKAAYPSFSGWICCCCCVRSQLYGNPALKEHRISGWHEQCAGDRPSHKAQPLAQRKGNIDGPANVRDCSRPFAVDRRSLLLMITRLASTSRRLSPLGGESGPDMLTSSSSLRDHKRHWLHVRDGSRRTIRAVPIHGTFRESQMPHMSGSRRREISLNEAANEAAMLCRRPWAEFVAAAGLWLASARAPSCLPAGAKPVPCGIA